GVTALALLSLALGIGANTLAFSFVNVLFFRALPYPNPDRVVITKDNISPDECLALREQANDVFTEFACLLDGDPIGASIADADPGASVPEHVFCQRLTPGFH